MRTPAGAAGATSAVSDAATSPAARGTPSTPPGPGVSASFASQGALDTRRVELVDTLRPPRPAHSLPAPVAAAPCGCRRRMECATGGAWPVTHKGAGGAKTRVTADATPRRTG